MDLITRFETQYVPEPNTGCWLWTGEMDTRNQYGVFRLVNRPVGAHRMSFELYKGEIPKGMLICHACDVMACVNPAHLWLGTKRDMETSEPAKTKYGGVSRHCVQPLRQSICGPR